MPDSTDPTFTSLAVPRQGGNCRFPCSGLRGPGPGTRWGEDLGRGIDARGTGRGLLSVLLGIDGPHWRPLQTKTNPQFAFTMGSGSHRGI
jgi:hypothetical protein